MKLEILTDEGLNEKYYQWKDMIIHTLLKPLITKEDNKHTFDVYTALTTPNLKERYGEGNLARLDKNYNRLVQQNLVFLVRLVRTEDLHLIRTFGYGEEDVFSVFKDDLLKANPATCLDFDVIDVEQLKKQKLN